MDGPLLVFFCNTRRKKCNFFLGKLPIHDKRIIFFFIFSVTFFLKVKCRINSKSFHKWVFFNLKRHTLVGKYGLFAKGYVFGAIFEPLGNHNKWRTNFKLVAHKSDTLLHHFLCFVKIKFCVMNRSSKNWNALNKGCIKNTSFHKGTIHVLRN